MKDDYLETQICKQLSRLKSYARALCDGNETEAEDLYSESIIQIWKAIRNKNFNGSISIYSYMKRCMWSVFITQYRRDSRMKRILDDRAKKQFKMVIDGVETDYEAAVEQRELINRIRGFRNLERLVIILRIFQDMGYAEIAEMLRMNSSTVRAHIHKLRKRMVAA